MQKVNWNYPTEMWIGENRIKDLVKACKKLKINKPLLVTDSALSKNSIIKVPDIKDHRIFQSTAILALVTGAKANMKNFETVFTSAPSFLKIIKSLGGKFEIQR